MANQYGFARAEQMSGMKLSEFIDCSNPKVIANLRNFIRCGYQLNDIETALNDKNGKRRYFLNNLDGEIESGMLRRTWVLRRDITDPKHVTQILRRNEARLRRQNAVLVELANSQIHDENDCSPSIKRITELATETLEVESCIDAIDAATDPRTAEFLESYSKPLGIVSMLDVPIRVNGCIIGVVCHEHTGESALHVGLHGL